MTAIKKHYFEHNGRKYFRGNAENVQLCAYGDKHDPVGAEAYLDVQAKVKDEHIAKRNVQFLQPVSINWNTVTAADLGGSATINVFGISGERAVDAKLADAGSGDFKLVGFAMNALPIKQMLNQDADGARKFLADEGSDGRIVSEVWVVMRGETADSFAAAASYTVAASVAGLGLEITAQGGTKGSRKVVLSAGSTFAYGMHKVKNWDKGKDKIEELEADYKGMS